ncbi:hypothetical protein ACFQ44_03985 [Levilactobacillus lanxiensis]|uniref:DUF2147 domain-containing protein n=1 Tax=Levilactobacillus lanxiensis TaxID=2799568 RepID=A0ABW4D2M7_9LACO|nr:hypothetical protein [Levilactobacillus lanxiensis]
MRKLAATLMMVTALGFGSSVVTTTTANASTWHKGTPKVLRGVWKYSLSGKWKDDVGPMFKLTKTTMKTYGRGSIQGKASYKALGHHKYQVKTKAEGKLPPLNFKFQYVGKNKMRMVGTGYSQLYKR